MSEQWWAVKHKPSNSFCFIDPDEKEAYEYICDPMNRWNDYAVITVRIVEDAEPCEWELTQNDVGVYEFSCFKFCPMCGRSLEGIR